MLSRRQNPAFLLLLSAVLSAQAMAPEPVVVPRADFAPASPQIGVNLEGIADYGRSMMFVDAMKSARRFGTAREPWDEKAPIDDQGWPTSDAGVVVMADTPVKPGEYLFSCTGRCTVGMASPGTIKNQAYDRANNTTFATISIPDKTTSLFLTFKNTSGGIQNIRLLRPGVPRNTRDVFTREFLAMIAPFSTLRTMDLTLTNNSNIAEWSARPTPDDALQGVGNANKGVAWEYAIQLANHAKKDLWINVPDRASDDYVRQLAKLFKETLDPSRNLYVEYSNEVWNSTFKQNGRNFDAAKAEVAAGDRQLNDGGKDDNPHYWAWKRVSKRTLQIAKIFEEVFGSDAINTRIRPVLASQSANSFMTRLQLEYIAKYHGPPANYIYGLAGAPYFGPDPKISAKTNASIEELLNSAAVDPWPKKVMTEFALLSRYYRLRHLCYEGGLGLEGEHSLPAKIAANRDPRVANLLTDYLNTWYGTGGDLFMYYSLSGTWTRHGCWGLTDDARILTPKYHAVAAFEKAKSPPITVGASIPGLLQASNYDLHQGGGIENSHDGGKNLAYLNAGNEFYYLINVREPGDYAITLQTAAGGDGGRLALDLSGTPIGEVNTPKTGSGQTWRPTEPLQVKLEPGQLVLRMKVAHPGMNVRSIAFEKK